MMIIVVQVEIVPSKCSSDRRRGTFVQMKNAIKALKSLCNHKKEGNERIQKSNAMVNDGTNKT